MLEKYIDFITCENFVMEITCKIRYIFSDLLLLRSILHLSRIQPLVQNEEKTVIYLVPFCAYTHFVKNAETFLKLC